MKVTLQVNGREMTFSEEELITIVEKHLLTETTKKATMKEVARKPTEDKYFEVKPLSIDQNLFARKRNNIMQNEMRQLILEAFEEMEKHPKKYGKNFKTMMPKKTWGKRSVKQLKEIASKMGDHNADWVEQALEWAQRISNGESWKSICNTADTANWYRMVVWKDGVNIFKAGGSTNSDFDFPASNVSYNYYCDDYVSDDLVPLVVSYE